MVVFLTEKLFFILLNSSELLFNLLGSALCGPAFSASKVKGIYIASIKPFEEVYTLNCV